MNITEIVTKLVGQTKPYGSTDVDNERYENLKVLCELTQDLTSQIKEISEFKDSPYYSEKTIGEYADNFLKDLVNENSL